MVSQMDPARDNGTGENQRSTNWPRQAAAPSGRSEKLPPHSEEAEQGVLGCILLSPSECLDECGKHLPDPEAFYLLRNRTIYQTCLEMKRNGQAIDLITLQQVLRDKGELEKIGGLAYLSGLPDTVPSAANLEYYLKIVGERYSKRRVIQTCYEVLNIAHEGQAGIEVIADMAADAFASLAKASHGNGKAGLSIRKPDEILGMAFDESDCLLGDRLLAKAQPLSIVGAGGLGKSRLLLQLAVATITGREFIGLPTRGQELKWLVLQAENSNRRLQSDLRHLRQWVGQEDWARVNQQLIIHTLETHEDGFLGLDNESAVCRLANVIAENEPDIIVYDSLYNFGIGDLNKDADMSATLLSLSRLARQGNPERAIIVLHHALTGKAGAARATGFDRASFGRNSKVLHAWTRGQINIAPGSPDNSDSLVLACGKCSNGREFAPFAVRLNPATMIYEVDSGFDLRAWEADMAGKRAEGPTVTVEKVAKLCIGSQTKKELVKAIMEDTGCGKSMAYLRIDQAQRAKLIHLNPINDCYVAH